MLLFNLPTDKVYEMKHLMFSVCLNHNDLHSGGDLRSEAESQKDVAFSQRTDEQGGPVDVIRTQQNKLISSTGRGTS